MELPLADDAQLPSEDVAQQRALTVINVDDVEVEPVGLLVVGMSRGVGHVDFVLAVACVLGVGPGAGRLHHLIGAVVEGAVAVGIGHGEAGDGGVPAYAAPAEVDVLRVVAEDEGRGIGGVVLRLQPLLLAQGGDVAGLL